MIRWAIRASCDGAFRCPGVTPYHRSVLPIRHGSRILRLLVGVVGVGLATLAVAALEGYGKVPDASSVYLVAVVATAIAAGTAGAVAAAVTSILLYDYLFTQPFHTLTVADPGEWLSLVLLLFVAVTVGQLTALQRRRADVALAREREARALFQVIRALAIRESTFAVLPAIANTLVEEAGMDRVWFALGTDDARERVAADSGDGVPPPSAGSFAVLHRPPGPAVAKWTRVRDMPGRPGVAASEDRHYRIRIEAGGATLGSIWALRRRSAGEPDRTATRLLAAAADQVGQALAQDHLALEARQAEIARQSDALKSALLESVSHDLRTPLASIRASAGTLMDPDLDLSPEDARASATLIDREAERLNELVANLLDLGRIEGGALRAANEVLDVEELVNRVVGHVERRVADRVVEIEVRGAPAVRGDPVLLEEALLNVVDNAVRHTPRGTRIRVATAAIADEQVRVTVEDSGPGVPADALPRLFEKFYRVPQGGSGSRAGIGIGLAVARGLVEAMGGHVSARPSELGGLAIDIDLRLAQVPAALAAE